MELHLLRVECDGLRALVRVNGVDVFTERVGAARQRDAKVDAWLGAGANRLEVFLAPRLDGESAAMEPSPGASFSVKVLRTDFSATEPLAVDVIGYAWDRVASPLDGVGPFAVFAGVFVPSFTRGPWLWESADARPFTAEDTPDILGALDTLHAAMAARDVATLQTLLRTKHDEVGRAVGVTRERIEHEMTEYLREVMAPEDWSVPRPDPQTLVVNSWAGGRLLGVTDAFGRPPLVGQSKAGTFALPLVLSRTDGVWFVAR